MATNTKTKTAAATKTERMEVTAPRFAVIECPIVGTTPYCQNRFASRDPVFQEMIRTQEAGSTGKSKKKREAKNFDARCKNATYYSTEGWIGIPCSAFRNAMISACRTIGVVMVRAKLALIVIEDGYDDDSTPLVRITKGEPERKDAAVRNASGVIDIRPRPVWQPGWEATVRIRYDQDMLTDGDITNLLIRAGMQVGIGEGRPDSKKSCGIGWGLFDVVSFDQ